MLFVWRDIALRVSVSSLDQPRISAREWSYARKALKPVAALTNDGDEEGVLFLDRLPTVEEAETIRQYVGVAKKRVLSDEERERLTSLGHRFEKRSDVEGGDQREKPALEDAPATPVAESLPR